MRAVIWMHTRELLNARPATELLPTVLAAAVLLELAPVGAGLILASPLIGASLGAELASMRLGNRLMHLSCSAYRRCGQLVAPRVGVCAVGCWDATRLLAVLGISSGYAAEWIAGHTTWLKYRAAVLQELQLNEVLPAGFDAASLERWSERQAVLSASTRRAARKASAGEAATDSVVVCSLLVLATDVLLVGVIRVLV